MNPSLSKLHPYPFEKLQMLKQGITPAPGLEHIALSVGEPRHAAPDIVVETLKSNLPALTRYPATRGIPELREAISGWLTTRFELNQAPDPEHNILPVSGTREALFSIAQAVIDRSSDPLVIMPNPFYQIYEGAALLAGAEPFYMNTRPGNGYLPEFDRVPETVWKRCRLLYICSPGNPSGAVIPLDQLEALIELSLRYDFIIAADECYSEIYPDETNPPPGLLQAAASMGHDSFRNCLVFHSLSKRSNLPGLRSGFVAGDAKVLERYFQYRTYQGCAMPVPSQYASACAWQDESHVLENREAYREKFSAVLEILDPVWNVSSPDASFYLWPQTPFDDQEFARRLFQKQNLTVLPGSFLSRVNEGINPGARHVRIALVASVDECIEAAQRIRHFLDSF